MHKATNVRDALPKSAHPAARKALAEIRDADDRQHAEKAIMAYVNLFDTKHPKAVAKVVDDTEQLLAFYDFPPSTGCTSRQAIPSNPPSRPCGCGPK
jgi:putative transposase